MKARLLLLAALFPLCASAGDPPSTNAPAVAPAQSAAPASAVPLVGQDALLERQARHDASLFLLDVRTPEEYAQGHVPGAVNIPHDQVASRLADIPKDKDVVLYCRSGRRAGLAAEVLGAHGYTRLLHLDGDMNAWVEKARPVEGRTPAPADGH